MSDNLENIAPSKNHDGVIQLVTFCLGNEDYGVDVLKVREIIRVPGITRTPSAPSHLEGIINLRGRVIPIISMCRRFNLMETDYSGSTRIMVMDIGGELYGFVVDAVSEVVRISADEIQAPPDMVCETGGEKFISGIINHNERLLAVLELERVFSHEEGLSWVQ